MNRHGGLVATVSLIALTVSQCSQPTMMMMQPDTSPGCQAGNRSQCVTQVSLGAYFGCAMLSDGSVWCWGRNDESQLGYSTTDLCPENLPNGQTQSVACHQFPFQVPALTATKIASGAAFSCALDATGSLSCWGNNDAGQLGNGSTLPSMTPVAVPSVAMVSSYALGARHVCAVSATGVRCWGANDRLQLGSMTGTTQCGTGSSAVACATSPVMPVGLNNVTDLAAGVAHTCARTSDGHVLCWGDNQYGQLGNGMAGMTASAMPQMVRAGAQPLDQVDAIAAGAYHTCALRAGGVYCWGRNDHGELGVAPGMMMPAQCGAACSMTAIAVTGLEGTSSPFVMDGGVSRDGGAIADAGHSDGGMLADGGHSIDAGMHDSGGMTMGPAAVAITAGDAFSCARLSDGTVDCWGSDTVGQLGDGQNTMDPQLPTLVIASPGAARNNPLQMTTSVVAGEATACALLGDGSLRCWGSNQDGALGIGGVAPQAGPVPVTW